MSFEEAMKGALEKSASKGDLSVIIFPHPLLAFLLLPVRRAKREKSWTRTEMQEGQHFHPGQHVHLTRLWEPHQFWLF